MTITYPGTMKKILVHKRSTHRVTDGGTLFSKLTIAFCWIKGKRTTTSSTHIFYLPTWPEVR